MPVCPLHVLGDIHGRMVQDLLHNKQLDCHVHL